MFFAQRISSSVILSCTQVNFSKVLFDGIFFRPSFDNAFFRPSFSAFEDSLFASFFAFLSALLASFLASFSAFFSALTAAFSACLFCCLRVLFLGLPFLFLLFFPLAFLVFFPSFPFSPFPLPFPFLSAALLCLFPDADSYQIILIIFTKMIIMKVFTNV